MLVIPPRILIELFQVLKLDAESGWEPKSFTGRACLEESRVHHLIRREVESVLARSNQNVYTHRIDSIRLVHQKLGAGIGEFAGKSECQSSNTV